MSKEDIDCHWPAALAVTNPPPPRHHPVPECKCPTIVAYVAQHQPCGFAELLDKFGEFASIDRAALRFRKRLSYLTVSGQLRTTNFGTQRQWHMPIGMDPTVKTQSPSLNAAVAAAIEITRGHWTGTIVPPSQHDVMHSPPYVPEAGPAMRAGSLDFKRLGSRGVHC